ncbi:hypothetical protein GXB84_02630 [Stenotrophomonas acidaminiphila]|uniref:hypothetical protein n=1 Tax=Stenotrophomonas acidaminiphila TaxID=128780 RepID=UPI0013756AD3|nr:hypothetical protein [Stenotrophomonas acidaminiphila]NCT86226.1 hypothetical protein [Stenotrophomonas acidaminiphila]
MELIKRSPATFLLLALLGAVLAVLCFTPGLNGGFILDDRANITENAALYISQFGGEDLLYAAYSFQPGGSSRILSMLSFALDYWRGGMDAAVFKTTNLVIHGLTALALALFLRQLLGLAKWPPRRAAAGAVVLATLWALHPLQVSSVLYVVQRMQTLVTLFMVLALWAYLCMRKAQMAGLRSRQYGVLVGLFWALGFASKEDAALFPLYALALELTVLHFSAASPQLAVLWRRGCLAMAVVGVALYALLVVPHYWHWGAYPGRDFSSYERLLTQGRVLVMYLGQMLWPLPSRLPFFYDDLVISRGLLQPVATLPALLLLIGLLAWAWCWRKRRPLFAFGMLLFFAGHFMTSNVLNLELAFEHRNQLPLIGVLLAVADLCMAMWQRLAMRPPMGIVLVMLLVSAFGVATAWRSYMWGEPLRFAAETLRLLPRSERAWLLLGGTLADRSGFKVGSRWLDLAITTNERGAEITGSAVMLSNVVVYKTLRGDVAQVDWEKLLARMPQVPMNAQNKGIAFTMLENAESGMALDEEGVVKTLEYAAERAGFTSNQYLRMAAYIHNRTQQQEKALPFLRRAVMLAPPDDPEITDAFAQLTRAGQEGWVRQLQQIERGKAAAGNMAEK